VSDEEGNDKNELDGEILRPEWDGCKTFVKVRLEEDIHEPTT